MEHVPRYATKIAQAGQSDTCDVMGYQGKILNRELSFSKNEQLGAICDDVITNVYYQ